MGRKGFLILPCQLIPEMMTCPVDTVKLIPDQERNP